MKIKSHRQGISLLEIVVEIPLTALLLLLISGTFISILNVRNRIQKNIQAQQINNQVLTTINNDIKWADTINYTSPTLTLTYANYTVQYTYQDKQIVRNYTPNLGTPITENLIPPKFEITQFSLIDHSSNPQLPSYQVNVTLSYNYSGIPVTISTQTAVSVRNRYY